jgi:hypothetical protein
MKKIIIKKIWFAVFALFLVGSSLEVSAQITDANAPNANHTIATDYNVSALAYGTLDLDNSFLTLNAELDNMKSSYDTKEYRYYWLVAVDAKRNNIALEDALLINLAKVDQEFATTNSALQALYNNTVNMLQ